MISGSILLLNFLILLVNNNIIHKIVGGNSFFKKVIRRTLYFLPYIIFFYTYKPYIFSNKNIIKSVIIIVLLTIIMYTILYNKYNFFFNEGFIFMCGKIKFKDIIVNLYTNIGSALVQESFYKLYVFQTLFYIFDIRMLYSVTITSIIFMLDHLLCIGSLSRFRVSDFISQFIMSFISLILYVYSGNIIIAFSLHFLYNLFISFNNMYMYYIQNKSKGR